MTMKYLTFVNQNFSMNKTTKTFIQAHLTDDVLSLGLQAAKYPEVDIPLAVRQISGLQKIKNKVPLFYEHPEILFPVQLSVEQSSSQLTANYKSTLSTGSTFADLTGGFGVDFYFLSQYFTNGIYVERDEQLCALATHNFAALGIKSFEVINQNAEDFLTSMQLVDLIYIDPHRRSATGKKTVRISDCEPNVAALATRMLEKSPKVIIKLSPMLDINQAIKDIPQTSELHIIAVENECKEVLLVLNRRCPAEKITDNPLNSIIIKTVNFLKDGGTQLFDFQLDTEVAMEATYVSEPIKYLYEPNAAIMKSGAFKSIAVKFELKKFHPNTHLYTSNSLIKDFPGRKFAIQEVFGNTKGDFSLLKQKFPKANVATRNYPLTVEAYKKKSGIKDGGDVYIFALKASDGNFLTIVCSKIDQSLSD